MRHLTIMLPTLDEAGAIGSVIDRIPWHVLETEGWHGRVVVIDGGSSDGTAELAERQGAIVHQQPGIGKGDALRFGFSEFLQSGDDALVMLNAVGPTNLRSSRLASWIIRCPGDGGGSAEWTDEAAPMSRFNLRGNLLLTWLAGALHGTMSPDLCTGMWAFRRQAIAGMSLNSMRFEIEAELYASCARQNLRIGSMPITYGTRIGDPKLGSIRDGATILRKIVVRRVFTEARNRIGWWGSVRKRWIAGFIGTRRSISSIDWQHIRTSISWPWPEGRPPVDRHSGRDLGSWKRRMNDRRSSSTIASMQSSHLDGINKASMWSFRRSRPTPHGPSNHESQGLDCRCSPTPHPTACIQMCPWSSLTSISHQ